MYLHTFVLALTLATGLGSPLVQYQDFKDASELQRLKTLMDAFLDWALHELETLMKIPPTSQTNVKLWMEEIPIHIDIEYLKCEEQEIAKPFVDKFYIDPHTLDSTFRISVPRTSTTAKYKLNGTCLGHNVTGEGHLTFATKDFSMTVSDLKFHDDPRSLRVTSMKVSFNKGDMKIKFDGLKVAGMSLDDFEKELKTRIVYIIDKMKHLSVVTDEELKWKINHFIAGRSLKEMVRWFKKNSKGISYK